MLASMDPKKGRVGVVMPHGVLFRGGAESRIRECLIQGDLLEAVIGLPPNLFYSTAIPACLLIFRAQKPEARRGSVLFVDGSKRFMKGRSQNQMVASDIEAILTAYQRGEDGDSELAVPTRLVDHGAIKENGWDLNIGRYVKTAVGEALDIQTALAALIEAREALREAEARLDERLEAGGYA
jgi:type I restriction enzyme M protein